MNPSQHRENCTHCGSPIPQNSQFCPACGQVTALQSASAVASSGSHGALNTLGAQPTFFPQQPVSATSKEWQAGEKFARRYEIQQPLGRGGMGSVYLANDEVSGKQVAIKILNSDRLSDNDVQRLISEGTLARDIRHRNVVAVYDADIHDGQPFVTMEYISGSTLRDLLRQKQATGQSFTFVESASIIWQILEGLEAAHQAQVVHRDLKPENVMVVDNPKTGGVIVKILDFGIAKNETQSHDSGSTAGTLGYMSPEQFTSADLVGPSSDIYAVSVIFYELLVGALPRGHWQPPSQGRDDVPKEIDDLIEKGLSNRALNRPQTAAEYRAQLENSQKGSTASGWQNGVAELGKSLGENWTKNWGLGSKSEWWNSLTFQTKAWIIAGIIAVAGILGVAMDDTDQKEHERTNSNIQRNY